MASAQQGLGDRFRRNPELGVFGQLSVVEVLTRGLAECVGTAILVFCGCMGVIPVAGAERSLLQICLTFGFVVGLVIQIIGHISAAHLNPAVTICALLLGHFNFAVGGVYMVAQMVGATLGYGLIECVTPASVRQAECFCVTKPGAGVSGLQGALVETLITGVLVLVACGAWDSRNADKHDSVALRFAITIAGLALAAAPYSGASMNPARSFAPALWNWDWEAQWVYWVGPCSGAIVGTLFYIFVIGRQVSSPAQQREEIPLKNRDDAVA